MGLIDRPEMKGIVSSEDVRGRPGWTPQPWSCAAAAARRRMEHRSRSLASRRSRRRSAILEVVQCGRVGREHSIVKALGLGASAAMIGLPWHGGGRRAGFAHVVKGPAARIRDDDEALWSHLRQRSGSRNRGIGAPNSSVTAPRGWPVRKSPL
jgi:hypothetical protein